MLSNNFYIVTTTTFDIFFIYEIFLKFYLSIKKKKKKKIFTYKYINKLKFIPFTIDQQISSLSALAKAANKGKIIVINFFIFMIIF